MKSRIGQGLFKQRLSNLEGKCKLCGLDNADFLRAVHDQMKVNLMEGHKKYVNYHRDEIFKSK